jgi:hypothetical protein
VLLFPSGTGDWKGAEVEAKMGEGTERLLDVTVVLSLAGGGQMISSG